ncbi:hypothetical protein K1T71_000429 [Dendrolimus kikuchii]|uniref:Uncharacterized protein n=1 Tax=Dendrolimus kikuchii TaxID=765133 RepID=A0ACC1DKN4_9NEOP|nr:hypothetical protein K1T71_000429 [Dendrolimus kikuchii]
MTDSSSFSSLLALVDSHLSKCSLQTSDTPGMSKSIPIVPLNGIHKGHSDTNLSSPSQRLPLPPFSISDNPINNVLADQVSNMLKAKAKKEQDIKETLENNIKKHSLEEDEDYIDLVKAIQEPKHTYVPPIHNEESKRTSPDFVLLDDEEFVLEDDLSDDEQDSTEWLPCTTDMSYILKEKVTRAKCSPFGKVLAARLKPVAAPYLHEKVESNIKRFDFKLRSPCDCIAEKLRRPTTYTLPSHVRFGMFDVDPIMTQLNNL